MRKIIKILVISESSLLVEGFKLLVANHFIFSYNAQISNSEKLCADFIVSGHFDLVIVEDKNVALSEMANIKSIIKLTSISWLVFSKNVPSKNIEIYKKIGLNGVIFKSETLPVLSNKIVDAVNGYSCWPTITSEYKLDLLSFFDIGNLEKNLTIREFEVLSHLKNGLLNKQIAYHMKIKESTVKTYVSKIIKMFGARNRTHLAFVLGRLPV
ncbi:response regulator transcription factor [Neptunomonas sp.]|uniref:response regulator transcription factor n=1 Tax=Neptunomonas sp. TaxID=1971898 RepID=UPI00356974C2